MEVMEIKRNDIVTLSGETGGSGPETDGDGQWS